MNFWISRKEFEAVKSQSEDTARQLRELQMWAVGVAEQFKCKPPPISTDAGGGPPPSPK